MRTCRKHGEWDPSEYSRCPVCNREKTAAWIKANPEKVQAYKDTTKARYNEYLRQRQQRLKAEVMNIYGGRCECCGETNLVFLTIDHPARNGSAHRRELYGKSQGCAGTKTYWWLKKSGWPAGYRVLCWNCQFSTYRGVCPHQLA